ncbi:kinetochore-associated Ndc80 complex subunit ndc80 [Elasticomyces elasticus]|nr:kinetochore-associated Ndc80 complex subunit ndc80 [Elasticomyces elasticus]
MFVNTELARRDDEEHLHAQHVSASLSAASHVARKQPLLRETAARGLSFHPQNSTNTDLRQTLGSVSHNATSIPQPASAMKRSTSTSNLQAPHTTQHIRTTSMGGSHRMSLAPNRPAQPVFQRSSSGTNLAEMGGFSTVQRPSTANFFASTGRKSYAPVTSTPAPHPQMQNLADSTQRRSSVYTARQSQAGFGPQTRQSFFSTAPPAPSNAQVIDPRRLKDGPTRQQMGTELLEFLSQRNFEMEVKHTLSHKSVTNPIQKDFDTMFQFLYHCIDPSYRFQKKMDVEVPPLLKQLRYPFEKHISKSGLGAVGGNNWPVFLGLLHWIMGLARMMEEYSTGVYDGACVEAGFDVSADRITFTFLGDAYREWLSMDEEDESEEEAQRRLQPHVDAMARKFEEGNRANLEQVAQLEAEGKELERQIEELSRSAPKLAKLDETIKILEEDRAKFEAYNASMETKVEKYLHRAEVLREEMEKYELELQEAEQERAELQRRVDEQGLSISDIDRMNGERERLQKGVETTSARLEEAKDRTSKKEAETGEKLDELEGVVEGYNGLGWKVGIIPSTASNASGEEYELRLRLNKGPDFSASQSAASQQQGEGSDRLLADAASGYQAKDLLPSTDLRALKALLHSLRKSVSDRRTTLQEADLASLDLLDKTREALDDKNAELESLSHRVRLAQEEFEGLRESAGARAMSEEGKIEGLERELGILRRGLGEVWEEGVVGEVGVELAYEQLQVSAGKLREDMHTELERMLNEVIKFKIHIQGSLERQEEFVAGEVEREVEERLEAEAGGAEGKGEGWEEEWDSKMEIDDE